jgi:hypothetical protein
MLWAKAQQLFIDEFTLNTQTTTTFSSSGANHVSTFWCPHSGTKPRGSFSLTTSAAQCPLHTFLLLADFYKKSQSLMLLLLRQSKHISG